MQTRVPTPDSYRKETSFPSALLKYARSKSSALRFERANAPGTTHQSIVLKMAAALLQYVEAENLGHVLHATSDVFLSRETIIRPDILFVKKDRVGIIGQNYLCGLPDLVIEVLPHRHRTSDFHTKKNICSCYGVQEFWAVDFARQNVETLFWCELGYVSGGSYSKSDRLSSPQLPNLNLPLSRIFDKYS